MAQNNRPDGELHRNSTLVQTSDTTTTATPPAVVKPPQGSDEHSDPSSIGKTDISHLVDQAAQCCLGQAVQRVTSYNIVFHRCILNRLESHVGQQDHLRLLEGKEVETPHLHLRNRGCPQGYSALGGGSQEPHSHGTVRQLSNSDLDQLPRGNIVSLISSENMGPHSTVRQQQHQPSHLSPIR